MDSLAAQEQHYEELIKANPSWQFAGSYSDVGSGTTIKGQKRLNALNYIYASAAELTLFQLNPPRGLLEIYWTFYNQIKNTGQQNQYVVTGNHKAIIDTTI